MLSFLEQAMRNDAAMRCAALLGGKRVAGGYLYVRLSE